MAFLLIFLFSYGKFRRHLGIQTWKFIAIFGAQVKAAVSIRNPLRLAEVNCEKETEISENEYQKKEKDTRLTHFGTKFLEMFVIMYAQPFV